MRHNLRMLYRHAYEKILTMPMAGGLILSAALGSLAFAFVMQYGFDIRPCVLCLWQRVPFGLTAMLALTAILFRPYGPRTRILLFVCAFIFLIGFCLALFHTGVELHWWLGTTGCAIKPLHGSTPADLRAELLSTDIVRCDRISWTLLGLSMANWNVPFSLGLAGFSSLAAFHFPKPSHPPTPSSYD